MLVKNGYESKIIEVIDGNCIDKYVHQFKPKYVVIEAYWVTPDKFKQLQKLHPSVTWIVRNHSRPPFLSNEGIAFEWSLEYAAIGIKVASNTKDTAAAFTDLFKSRGLPAEASVYLPNYYFDNSISGKRVRPKVKEAMNVGCFGAIRPLKNQMNQVLAAMAAADKLNLPLRFHVNSSRVEGRGESILKSIRAVFNNHPRHSLVEHFWLTHANFLDLIKEMDLVSQVSYSETFNVVAADALTMNVPVVYSDEIFWLKGFKEANPNIIPSITNSMVNVMTTCNIFYNCNLKKQVKSLQKYNDDAEKVWLNHLT